MAYSYDSLKAGYQEKWDDMRIQRTTAVAEAANRIYKNLGKYQEISKAMGNGLPPEMIGVIHLRESDLDFNAHLHNGDKPLSQPTRHVPRGRGPFDSFKASAIDALNLEGAGSIRDWDIPRQSWFLEKFNGFGYQHKSGGNPYLYGGTNEYTSGKYVADGVYDPSYHDTQLGVMAILKQLSKLSNYKDTKDEVVENSTKLTLLKRVRLFFVGLGGTLYTADTLGIAKDILTFVKENALWELAGAALVMWLIFKWVEFRSVDDHLKGNYIPSGMDTAEIPAHEPPVKANAIPSESAGDTADHSSTTADHSGAASDVQ